MTPEELAKRHSRLYHVPEPGASLSIQKNGLLSTSALLNLFEVQHPASLDLQRRPTAISLDHPHHGYSQRQSSSSRNLFSQVYGALLSLERAPTKSPAV